MTLHVSKAPAIIVCSLCTYWRSDLGWFSGPCSNSCGTISGLPLDSSSGSDDRNYAARIAKGENVTHDYNRVVTKIISKRSANIQSTYKSGSVWGFGTYKGTHGTFGIEPDAADSSYSDMAVKRLKDHINAKSPSFQSLIPLGELREMGGLVKRSANLASNAVKTLAGLRGKKAAAKYAADAWLNYSFGVKPIVSDINSLLESIDKMLNRPDKVIRFTGKSPVKDWRTFGSSTGAAAALGTTGTSRHGVAHALSYKIVAGIRFDVLGGNSYSQKEHLGLDANQLPTVGWELLPYSWLLDYFGTMGDYLEDTFVAKGYSSTYVAMMKRYNQRVVHTCFADSIGSSWIVSGSPGTTVLQVNRFSRSSLASIPARTLRFKTSDEIAKGAVNKLLNLAGLLVK